MANRRHQTPQVQKVQVVLANAKAGQGGFTLVELMVALTVLSIAIAAAFSMAFSLMNGFSSHKRAMRIESTARIVLDLIGSGARAASPGITGAEVWDSCSGTTVPTIEVFNSSTAPDSIRMVYASGGGVAAVTVASDITTGSMTVDDTSSFETDIWTPAIIFEPNETGAHLVEVFIPSGSTGTTLDIRGPGGCALSSGAPPDTAYGAGSFIVRAVNMTFRVDPPMLLVDPDGAGAETEQVVAYGVEDLQVAIAIEDGVDPESVTEVGAGANDDEWYGNVAGETEPGTGLAAGNPLYIGDGNWRALRITVTGIDNRETAASGVNLRPSLEDRAASTAPDPYRRRTFSTTVELRNFSLTE